MKVYVTAAGSDRYLHRTINAFLDSNPNIRVIDIKYACGGAGEHSALIMYEEVDAA